MAIARTEHSLAIFNHLPAAYRVGAGFGLARGNERTEACPESVEGCTPQDSFRNSTTASGLYRRSHQPRPVVAAVAGALSDIILALSPISPSCVVQRCMLLCCPTPDTSRDKESRPAAARINMQCHPSITKHADLSRLSISPCIQPTPPSSTGCREIGLCPSRYQPLQHRSDGTVFYTVITVYAGN